jgi:glyoxylase-like metal-dependent hydrolase (beta-lactamase superfamily II)
MSRSSTRRALIAGGSCLALLAAAAQPGAALAHDRAAQRAIDLAASGLGGKRALRDLSAFGLQSRGETSIFDEGPRPGNTVTQASSFTLNLTYDLRAGGDRLRAEYVRRSLGTDRPVTEIISGRLGAISGVDANFSPAADRPMTSDRWAAVTREQRLLNPQLLVRPLLSRPRATSAGRPTRLRGRLHRVLVVDGDVAPVRLLIDARSGRIDRLVTLDHNPNRGDLRTIVDFGDWRRAAGGVWFPRRVTLRQGGQVLHDETRTEVRVNPSIAADRFAFPAEVTPYFDATLATRGARTIEWLMTFAHLGFIKDGRVSRVLPRLVAPGSTLLQGIANQSMLVEQQDGLVVVEGALNSERAESLIDYVTGVFPGKAIRYVTASHHHADHAGGMRPFVALGARPVVHADAVSFFQGVFARRGSLLLPDRLDSSSATANILPVPATGTVTLDDPLRPVTVLAEPTDHASTTILVFVPREGVLFVNGDTYTPASPPGPGARTLDQTIRANNLDVKWIVGGHGGVISYADFQAAVAQLPAG